MKITKFSLFRDYEIKCKLFEPCGEIKAVIVGVHGFAGDKESSMLSRLAESAKKSTALLCFDFPSHGESPVNEEKLTSKNCKADLLFVCDYVREKFPNAEKAVFATSFGGYITLLCCARLADFSIVLRAPAVTMPAILLENVLKISEEEFKKRGTILCGFERKMALPYSFYSDMEEEEKLLKKRFDRQMLIIHGDCDDIVPPSVIYEFAKSNGGVMLRIIEGADHRFKRRGEMKKIISYTLDYLKEENNV